MHFFLVSKALILFCTSEILTILKSFSSYNSTFNEEKDSRREIEEEVVCLFFISVVRKPFNNSDELGKVSLSSVSGVLVAINICGGRGRVW